jgi:hypothetical protein
VGHHQPTDGAYRAFVHELATQPGRAELLGRLRSGHLPDRHGWCDHASHAHRWERHPCWIVQLANLVEAIGRPARISRSATRG